MDIKENKLKAIKNALAILEPLRRCCELCPRRCRVNRLEDERGFCGIGDQAVVYSSFLHRGEEPGISGITGSGAIFFSGCSLKCVYCQNYKFSHFIKGDPVSDKALAGTMLELQDSGAANINLVTPTHVLPAVLRALQLAYGKGLAIPIVYNTSGYELSSTIKALSGIVDVYLTDIKYTQAFPAAELSGDLMYFSFAQSAFWEMHAQTRPLELKNGLLKKGLIVRHLVLPGAVENTIQFLSWLEDHKLKECFLSLMFQYRPYFKAKNLSAINRRVSKKEYEEVTGFFYSHCKSITRGWVQDLNTDDSLAGVNF